MSEKCLVCGKDCADIILMCDQCHDATLADANREMFEELAKDGYSSTKGEYGYCHDCKLEMERIEAIPGSAYFQCNLCGEQQHPAHDIQVNSKTSPQPEQEEGETIDAARFFNPDFGASPPDNVQIEWEEEELTVKADGFHAVRFRLAGPVKVLQAWEYLDEATDNWFTVDDDLAEVALFGYRELKADNARLEQELEVDCEKTAIRGASILRDKATISRRAVEGE